MRKRKILRHYKEFIQIQSIQALSFTLGIAQYVLKLQASSPQYEVFEIPKKSGGVRLIENPKPALKLIQRSLNKYLQSVYFYHKTKAAYGFIISVKSKPPRNIVTNAKRHLNNPYLLNVDFKDFFHAVDTQMIQGVFRKKPFQFSTEVAQLLTKLCCYNGRLPMGAPTSPVLTNFYAIELDRALGKYADNQNLVYTRYADDMSFSSDLPITTSHLQEIKKISQEFKLSL